MRNTVVRTGTGLAGHRDDGQTVLKRRSTAIVEFRFDRPDAKSRMSQKGVGACLNRMIFFGERSPRKVTRELASHYHKEINHQGLDNRLIEPDDRDHSTAGRIQCFQRLGGMLRDYRRAAA